MDGFRNSGGCRQSGNENFRSLGIVQKIVGMCLANPVAEISSKESP
jgi:hypothetical protein